MKTYITPTTKASNLYILGGELRKHRYYKFRWGRVEVRTVDDSGKLLFSNLLDENKNYSDLQLKNILTFYNEFGTLDGVDINKPEKPDFYTLIGV